jgi:hypothetical protein
MKLLKKIDYLFAYAPDKTSFRHVPTPSSIGQSDELRRNWSNPEPINSNRLDPPQQK